jgi:hypothetical protein
MAKTGKDLQQNKEKQFDELIQQNWYFNDVYTYLLKFENEFINLSLIDFILNCESATGNIFMALLNDRNIKDLTIKYIIEQKGYYDRYSILNDFELYLTKFIVAHCLVRYYKEDKKRTDFFNQILSISERQKYDYKYFADYGRYKYVNEYGICQDWLLKLNTKQYVTIDKKELAETLNKLKQTTTQPTPPQKAIEPIKWQKQSVLLAYLINELKTYGYIDEDSIWAICEQIFVDKKGKPIKAETFTSFVKGYENNKTPDGKRGVPKNHAEITELIKTLKALSKEIE